MEDKLKLGYVKLLDSYRAIAVISVALFHYFSRWPDIYPYKSKFDFFNLGKFGVQLFFIISGFVIFMTLENTKSYADFWKKRFNRLFPNMLVASLITLVFFRLFDTNGLFPTAHSLKNLLASLTFIKPDLLSTIFLRKIEFDYISGSYWSLWLEIQFYFYISTLYYIFRNKFLDYFLPLSTFLCVVYIGLQHFFLKNLLIIYIKSFFRIFELPSGLYFFVIGVLFYIMFRSKFANQIVSNKIKIYFLLNVMLVFLNNIGSISKIILFTFFIILFFSLVFFSKKIKFLENKLLSNIGISSYFFYLIHENIGVLIISKFKLYNSLLDLLIPVTILVLVLFFSVLYTKYLERYIKKFIKIN